MGKMHYIDEASTLQCNADDSLALKSLIPQCIFVIETSTSFPWARSHLKLCVMHLNVFDMKRYNDTIWKQIQ